MLLSSRNIDGDEGPQAWSFGLMNEGVEIFDATVSGTVADIQENGGLRLNGFEVTEIVDPERNDRRQGFVSAVVLSLTENVFLPANTSSVIARARYRANISSTEQKAHFRFVDNLRGSGQLVENVVTVQGKSFPLQKENRTIRILPTADPERRIPVIFIPGIMGTELYDAETGELIWLDPERIVFANNDPWLLRLLLQEDGITPDTRDRCRSDFSFTCTSRLNCPFLSECVAGGRQMSVGNILNIEEKFTSYKKFAEFLERNGYIRDTNFFLFGYDWRLDCGLIASSLRSIIENLTPNCGEKVNIIAHSQGGLVVRSYLLQYRDDHRVRKVIFLGTPHQGPAKAYAFLKGYRDIIKEMKWDIAFLEPDTQTLVMQNFPSVYELLPRYNFMQREDGLEPYVLTYSDADLNQGLVRLANNFHRNLGDPAPDDVELYAINGSGKSTVRGFRATCDGSLAVELDPDFGDGTVTLSSSTGFQNTQYFFVQEKHQDLPGSSAVQEKILNILEDRAEDPVEGVQTLPYRGTEESIVITTCSPVSLRVVDSEGNILGKNKDGGFSENITDSEFYVFPHNESCFVPKTDEYQVEILPKESGRFSLILENVDPEGKVTEASVYEDIPISSQGRAEVMLSPENLVAPLDLDVDGDGEEDFAIPPDTPAPPELEEQFVENGDVNRDRRLDMSDAIAIFRYLFLGDEIACLEAGDANSDSNFDLSDGISLLNYLFRGTADKPQGLAYCP